MGCQSPENCNSRKNGFVGNVSNSSRHVFEAVPWFQPNIHVGISRTKPSQQQTSHLVYSATENFEEVFLRELWGWTPEHLSKLIRLPFNACKHFLYLTCNTTNLACSLVRIFGPHYPFICGFFGKLVRTAYFSMANETASFPNGQKVSVGLAVFWWNLYLGPFRIDS